MPPASPPPACFRPAASCWLSASILGLAPILVRLTETGPAAAGFWRLLFALPLLLILVGRPGGEGFGRPSKWMLLAGLFFAFDLSFWHYGIVMTSVANATVLCNLTPVVVTLVGWFVFKERPARLFILALALAMGGAFAMAAGAQPGQGTNPVLGDLLLPVGGPLVLGLFPDGETGADHRRRPAHHLLGHGSRHSRHGRCGPVCWART